MKPISKKGDLKTSAPCEANSPDESAAEKDAITALLNQGIPPRTAQAMVAAKGKKQPK